jgi:hypothetical protein
MAWWLLATLLQLLRLCHYAAFAKRLVVFAGPHKTSETGIEEFFYSYAHGPGAPTAGMPHQQALKHWIWPQVRASALTKLGTQQHEIFGHLVTDADSPAVQEALLTGIQYQWEKAANSDGEDFQGMIIGSQELDRVGPSPYSDADNAIDAVHRVVDILSLVPTDVTIVLLYRYPRLDQWFSIFNFVPIELTPTKDVASEDPYRTFLCNPAHARKDAFEALWNAMHPLRVAKEYADQGYKVKVLDLSGIRQEGRDVEHVIGCEVLNAECDEFGYLLNLSDQSYLKKGQGLDDGTTNPFPDLTSQQQSDLEELFRMRDCAYSYDDLVQNKDPSKGGISIEVQNLLLTSDCSITEKQTGELLMDPYFFLNALQSQVGCDGVPTSIEDILDGAALPPDANVTYSWEEGYKDPLMGATGNQNDNDDASPKWTIPVFLFVFIGVAALGLVWIRRSDRKVELKLGRYSSAPRDLELNVRERTNLSSNIT